MGGPFFVIVGYVGRDSPKSDTIPPLFTEIEQNFERIGGLVFAVFCSKRDRLCRFFGFLENSGIAFLSVKITLPLWKKCFL